MRMILIISILMSSLLTLGQSYESKNGDSLSTRGYINTGIFFPNFTTSVRIDGQVLGTGLSLEDELKFDEQISVFYINGLVRVKERSQFLLSFTNMSRESSFSIDEEFTLNDEVFEVGAMLDMSFDVNYYALTYRYSFFNELNWNAGASFGVRAVEFIVKADAEASQFGEASVSESVIAPAALIGVHGSGYLTDKLLGRYTLEYLGLNVNGIDINILESRASLEYFFFKNFGVGAAYSTTQYLVREVPFNDQFKGKIVFEFTGANLFLTARF